MALSGGQQQRLCIARAIAAEPERLLMDEPCSAIDPVATAKIEELILELKSAYTIVLVTHNMQQAARVVRLHGVLLPGPHRRVRADDPDLREPDREADRGVHHRPVRLSGEDVHDDTSATRDRQAQAKILTLSALVEDNLRRALRTPSRRATTTGSPRDASSATS